MKTKILSCGRSIPSFVLDCCFPGLLQPHRSSRGALRSRGLNNLGYKIVTICDFSTNTPVYGERGATLVLGMGEPPYALISVFRLDFYHSHESGCGLLF